jgi:putative oxidoreductase
MTAFLRSRAFERFVIFYARIALGAAFLSAVADRFGLWGPPGHPGVAWGTFARFVPYVAKLNPFMPAAAIPALAWIATIAEAALGLLLLLGVWPRWTAIASALLLALFGIAMIGTLGIKAPLDFSVFSASAAALLLALYQMRNEERVEPRKD